MTVKKITMEKLKKQYNKNGYLFSQVWRNENTAIYKQILPETGQAIGYEVFEIIKRGERKIGNNVIAAGEFVPGNEQWGLKGYTVHTIFEAKQKVAILQGNIRKRKIGETYRLAS